MQLLSWLVLAGLKGSWASLSCPNRAVHLNVCGEDSYVLKYDEEKNWQDAKKFCENMGGHLPDLCDTKSRDKLLDWFGTWWWVSYTDSGHEGQWFDSTDAKACYNENDGGGCERNDLPWKSGEPNDDGYRGEDCAQFSTDGFLNDISCYSDTKFLCVIPATVFESMDFSNSDLPACWMQWGSWSTCTGCNVLQSRTRACSKPESDCSGENEETNEESRKCVSESCTGFQTCTEVYASGSTESGTYFLDPFLSGSLVQVHCEMSDGAGKAYIDVDDDENFSRHHDQKIPDHRKDECTYHYTNTDNNFGKTSFSRYGLIIDSDALTVMIDREDRTFAETDGLEQPVGKASDCYTKCSYRSGKKGQFKINLKNTGWVVRHDVRWQGAGVGHGGPEGRMAHFRYDGELVQANCGGYCGHCEPTGPLYLDVKTGDYINAETYKIIGQTEAHTFNHREARAECHKMGEEWDLVIFEDEDEFDFVQKLIRQGHRGVSNGEAFWIGYYDSWPWSVSDLDDETTTIFGEKSSWELPWSKSNPDKPEPNDAQGKEHCVRMRGNTIGDTLCDINHTGGETLEMGMGAICEKHSFLTWEAKRFQDDTKRIRSFDLNMVRADAEAFCQHLGSELVVAKAMSDFDHQPEAEGYHCLEKKQFLVNKATDISKCASETVAMSFTCGRVCTGCVGPNGPGTKRECRVADLADVWLMATDAKNPKKFVDLQYTLECDTKNKGGSALFKKGPGRLLLNKDGTIWKRANCRVACKADSGSTNKKEISCVPVFEGKKIKGARWEYDQHGVGTYKAMCGQGCDPADIFPQKEEKDKKGESLCKVGHFPGSGFEIPGTKNKCYRVCKDWDGDDYKSEKSIQCMCVNGQYDPNYDVRSRVCYHGFNWQREHAPMNQKKGYWDPEYLLTQDPCPIPEATTTTIRVTTTTKAPVYGVCPSTIERESADEVDPIWACTGGEENKVGDKCTKTCPKGSHMEGYRDEKECKCTKKNICTWKNNAAPCLKNVCRSPPSYVGRTITTCRSNGVLLDYEDSLKNGFPELTICRDECADNYGLTAWVADESQCRCDLDGVKGCKFDENRVAHCEPAVCGSTLDGLEWTFDNYDTATHELICPPDSILVSSDPKINGRIPEGTKCTIKCKDGLLMDNGKIEAKVTTCDNDWYHGREWDIYSNNVDKYGDCNGDYGNECHEMPTCT